MKKSVLFALLLSLSSGLNAQWQIVNSPLQSGGVNNFTGIDFPTNQIGYLAGYNGRIYKTGNAGQSWTLVFESDLSNLIVFEGLRFFNENVGCAYGLNLDGSFGIQSTTNGGQTWVPFGLTVPLSYGRCWDAEWVSATTCYVSGEFGLVLKTTDGGMNWQPVAATPTGSSELFDVDFPTASTGFVLSGEGKLAKTINGGQSWTLLGDWDFKAIQFFDAQKGVACGFDGFFQTSDGGANWQNIASDAGFTKFQMDDDGLSGFAFNGGKYPLRTTDGGHTWFAQSLQTTFDYFFDALHTASPTLGWLSGYFTGTGPFLAKTTNSGGLGARIASWTDTLPCGNESLQAVAVVSGTTPASTEWLLDGQSIGTGLTLNWANGVGVGIHDLVFRTSDGIGVIELHRNVVVPDPPSYSASNFYPGAPSLCRGQQTGIYTNLIVAPDSFAFFINGQLWQGPKLVHAATEPFAFTTPVIAADTMHGQIVVQTFCGWVPVSSFDIVPKPSPVDTYSLSTDQTLLCTAHNQIYLKVSGSETNTMYFLYENGQYLFPPAQMGWSGPLLFSSNIFDSTRVFTVKAVNLGTYCESFLQDSLVVHVEHPSAAFYVTNGTNLPNDTPVTVEFTGNEAAEFDWDFGPQATPATSSMPQPGTIVFDNNTASVIQLITTAPLGCRDTFEQTVGLYQPGLLPEDWAMSMPFSYQISYPQSVAIDGQGNVYTHAQGLAQLSSWPTKAGTAGVPMRENGYSLVKYDPYGVLQWSVELDGFISPPIYKIAVDHAGNLFVPIIVPYETSQGDPFWFGSTDARRYKPSRNSYHAALLKYDTDGRLQWDVGMDVVPGGPTFERAMDVKTDAEGNVYFLCEQPYTDATVAFESIGEVTQTHLINRHFIAKYNTNGQLLWVIDLTENGQSLWGDAVTMEIDSVGNIFVSGYGSNFSNPSRPLLAKFDPQGNLVWKTAPNPSVDSGWLPTNLLLDSTGNIYLTGSYVYGLSLGPVTVVDNLSTGNKRFLVAKFNPSGQPIWVKTGLSQDHSFGNSMALHNGVLYVRGNITGDMFFENLQLTDFGYEGAFIFQLDASDGHPLGYNAFKEPDPNDPYAFYNCSGQSIEIDANGRLHLVGGMGYQVTFGNEVFTGKNHRYLMKGTPEFISATNDAAEEIGFSAAISPNPSTGAATLEINLNEQQTLNISVLDVIGRLESTIVSGKNFPAGKQMFRLDGSAGSLRAGLHFVVLKNEKGQAEVLKWVKAD